MPRAPLAVGLLLVAAWAGGTGSAAAADAPRAPGERPPVDVAIERGVAWLLEEHQSQGSFGSGGPSGVGPTALAVLALLHAGVREGGPSDADKRLTRALRWLDEYGPGREGAHDRDPGTYATSLLLMVLAARGRDADLPRMQRLADLLCRTQ